MCCWARQLEGLLKNLLESSGAACESSVKIPPRQGICMLGVPVLCPVCPAIGSLCFPLHVCHLLQTCVTWSGPRAPVWVEKCLLVERLVMVPPKN